jgi:hypothetical protein
MGLFPSPNRARDVQARLSTGAPGITWMIEIDPTDPDRRYALVEIEEWPEIGEGPQFAGAFSLKPSGGSVSFASATNAADTLPTEAALEAPAPAPPSGLIAQGDQPGVAAPLGLGPFTEGQATTEVRPAQPSGLRGGNPTEGGRRASAPGPSRRTGRRSGRRSS